MELHPGAVNSIPRQAHLEIGIFLLDLGLVCVNHTSPKLFDLNGFHLNVFIVSTLHTILNSLKENCESSSFCALVTMKMS